MLTAMRAGDPAGNVEATAKFIQIEGAARARRRLSWTPERTSGVYYHVIIDNYEVARLPAGTTELLLQTQYHAARAAIEIIEVSTQNQYEVLLHVAETPDDRVICTWDHAAGADEYRLYRRVNGTSDWGDAIHTAAAYLDTYSYADGPLTDGTYDYKLEALDDEGDLTNDTELAVTISSTPEPPTNLGWRWNAGAKTLTLSWTASTSADLDHYVIYHNDGSGAVRFDDAADDTEATTSWDFDMTGLSGEYEFLIRAVDADGNEEQGLEAMVAFSVNDGIAVGIPGRPRHIQVPPVAGGKVEVSFTYYPAEEGGGVQGIAHQANIYYDAGTGTMDWVTPLGSETMNNPTTPERFTFTSGALADDTYLFGVRVATATGQETTNADTYEVTTNDDTPAAVDLAVTVT